MSAKKDLLLGQLKGRKIVRFTTMSDGEGGLEIKVRFKNNKKTYWLVANDGFVFQNVWINTGRPHSSVTSLSCDDEGLSLRINIHDGSHIMAMIDIVDANDMFALVSDYELALMEEDAPEVIDVNQLECPAPGGGTHHMVERGPAHSRYRVCRWCLKKEKQLREEAQND